MRKAFANQRAHDNRESFVASLTALFNSPCKPHTNPAKGIGSAQGRKRRKDILAFMTSYTDEHGMPPTIREMGAASGLRSSSTVKSHLDWLVREGHVIHESQKPRSYRVANFRSWLADLSDHLRAASDAAESLEQGVRASAAVDVRGHLERAQAIVAQRMPAA